MSNTSPNHSVSFVQLGKQWKCVVLYWSVDCLCHALWVSFEQSHFAKKTKFPFSISLFYCYKVGQNAFRLTPRIIGGEKARIEQFKWQAVVVYDSKLLCGGSIISPVKLSQPHIACTESPTLSHWKFELDQLIGIKMEHWWKLNEFRAIVITINRPVWIMMWLYFYSAMH